MAETEAVEWLGACVQEWARDVYFTAARRVIRLADGSAKPGDQLEQETTH